MGVPGWCRRAGRVEPLAIRRGVQRSAAGRGETEGQAGGDGDGGMVHELEVQVRFGGVARVAAFGDVVSGADALAGPDPDGPAALNR
jgi:hypothetical protein